VAQELILLRRRSEASRADEIVEEFARRTALNPQPVAGGTSFALQGDDHRIKVIETLTAIDRDWAQHLAVGEPRG
jgi:hypothetical protein